MRKLLVFILLSHGITLSNCFSQDSGCEDHLNQIAKISQSISSKAKAIRDLSFIRSFKKDGPEKLRENLRLLREGQIEFEEFFSRVEMILSQLSKMNLQKREYNQFFYDALRMDIDLNHPRRTLLSQIEKVEKSLSKLKKTDLVPNIPVPSSPDKKVKNREIFPRNEADEQQEILEDYLYDKGVKIVNDFEKFLSFRDVNLWHDFFLEQVALYDFNISILNNLVDFLPEEQINYEMKMYLMSLQKDDHAFKRDLLNLVQQFFQVSIAPLERWGIVERDPRFELLRR